MGLFLVDVAMRVSSVKAFGLRPFLLYSTSLKSAAGGMSLVIEFKGGSTVFSLVAEGILFDSIKVLVEVFMVFSNT